MDKKKKHDRLKSLLKNSALEKPGADFTSAVMRELNAGAESSQELVLSSLLKRIPAQRAPKAFSANVIAQLDRHPSSMAGQPVVGTRFWFGLAAVFAAGVAWAWIASAPSSPQGLTPTLLKLAALINHAGGVGMYVGTAVAGSLLLLLDHTLRRKLSGLKT